MNKHLHRLVFDKKRGMRVAAAETARSAGKAAGGGTRSTRGNGPRVLSAAMAACVGMAQVMAATPIPRIPAAGTLSGRTLPNLPQPIGTGHVNASHAPGADHLRWLQYGAARFVYRVATPSGSGTPQQMQVRYASPDPVSGQLTAPTDDTYSQVLDANRMVIEQSTSKAILNWGSFNVGEGYGVQ